ncbi:unnamed protein product [Rhizophagus irregularis]|nr:unnamed protein product [Rhizophagus irregularis]
MDDDLGNINYGEWLDKTEELHDLTKRMLESMLKIFNQASKRQNLTIFTINIAGDVIELYAMRKESGIYNQEFV